MGNKVRELRTSKRISIRQLALQAGISPSYLSRLENGKIKNRVKLTTVEKIAKGLRVPTYVFAQAAGIPEAKEPVPSNVRPYDANDIIQIPVVGTIRCGPNGLAMNDYQGYESVSKDDIVEGENYFWLITAGDSMIGDHIQPDDYALIQRGSDFNNGDICAVIVDGEEGTLKHVTKTRDSIVLTASNSAYPPRVFVGEQMNDIYIAGKLVEIKHKF
ncbi:LexA family protein [Lentilactobacillus otakiensis]|uniref:LexA family protein n=1 Tax=Lentilactobacillus otakiensis TaxID=481720 RepID=UPI00293CF542|nr:XRE family transcriptional regulator [Lentilactobacillus otakiensis]MDV3519258.1 XRE family transcriptional regulator [Lentilactobacillus otakiensis]